MRVDPQKVEVRYPGAYLVGKSEFDAVGDMAKRWMLVMPFMLQGCSKKSQMYPGVVVQACVNDGTVQVSNVVVTPSSLFLHIAML